MIDERPASYAEVAYESIANRIFIEEYPVGARLVMDELADKLNMSRTPIRDALHRLAQEGVLESAGRKGYVVRRLDAEEIRQTFEARETLEGSAARIAARFGQEAAEHVRAAIKRAQGFELGTPLGNYDANRTVHRAVVEATRNEILLEFFDALWNRGRSHSLYAKCFADDDGNEMIRTKHSEIVLALAAGDAAAAQQAAVDHVRQGLKGLGLP